MKKIIKVAMLTSHFDITGIGTVMMNYCTALDKEKYDLTIIAENQLLINTKMNVKNMEFT